MEHINITNGDIVKAMNDETKHNFANHCILNKVEPEDVVEMIKNIINPTVNFAIDQCNKYFQTPAGKEYLEMRRKIDNIR